MDATGTSSSTYSTWSADTNTATGTAANFGISPRITITKPLQIPNYDNVPRIHKDKNGCIKSSYWATQPIDLQDLSGLTFNTSTGHSFFMGDTDDSANVRISSAST